MTTMHDALSSPSRRSVIQVAASAVLAFAGLAMSTRSFAQGSDAAPKKIGIIGSGNIGGTVGALWVKAGHPVMFSSRNPEKLREFAEGLGPLAHVGNVSEAIAFGDVVFLAVPYKAYPQIGKDYARQLGGKVVLDAGNAVPARDGEIAAEARANGIGLTSAKYLPGAHVVRAFNTLNYRVLASEANRLQGRIAIPIAGDDPAALAVAQTLVHDAGFDPVVIGPLESARKFAQGEPLYGQQITAPELRRLSDTVR
jgi:8-hydroxy-5-deazaflavin:NADPH oxidoreductase